MKMCMNGFIYSDVVTVISMDSHVMTVYSPSVQGSNRLTATNSSKKAAFTNRKGQEILNHSHELSVPQPLP